MSAALLCSYADMATRPSMTATGHLKHSGTAFIQLLCTHVCVYVTTAAVMCTCVRACMHACMQRVTACSVSGMPAEPHHFQQHYEQQGERFQDMPHFPVKTPLLNPMIDVIRLKSQNTLFKTKARERKLHPLNCETNAS